MLKRRFRLPSPALVISMVALALVLGGTAVAATTATHKDKKADTKLVKKLAPSLSVKHAKTADSATTATNATNATHATSATSATNATNATNATTAANANALGGVAASNYVQRNGNIYVQVGYSDWVPRNSTDPVNITRYSDTTGFSRTATGSNYFMLVGTLPTSLYGKALAFVGYQICYVASANNAITSVSVEKVTQTTEGFGGEVVIASDNTSRTDSACRTYSPSSPVTMTSADQFEIYLLANWTSAPASLYLGRVTAILQPTSSTATLPAKSPTRGGSAPSHSTASH